MSEHYQRRPDDDIVEPLFGALSSGETEQGEDGRHPAGPDPALRPETYPHGASRLGGGLLIGLVIVGLIGAALMLLFWG